MRAIYLTAQLAGADRPTGPMWVGSAPKVDYHCKLTLQWVRTRPQIKQLNRRPPTTTANRRPPSIIDLTRRRRLILSTDPPCGLCRRSMASASRLSCPLRTLLKGARRRAVRSRHASAVILRHNDTIPREERKYCTLPSNPRILQPLNFTKRCVNLF